MSVYVRGLAARRGIGSRLLAMAEEHARSGGATGVSVDASPMTGVEFPTGPTDFRRPAVARRT